MRISERVDNAVRAMAELAASDGSERKAEAIATSQDISLKYLLDIFRHLGADLGTAMGYVSLVERLVIGMALQASTEAQAQPQADFTTPEAATAAIAPLVGLTSAADAYPNLAEWALAPSGPSQAEQLELGLSMFVDGIAARHAAPQA